MLYACLQVVSRFLPTPPLRLSLTILFLFLYLPYIPPLVLGSLLFCWCANERFVAYRDPNIHPLLPSH